MSSWFEPARSLQASQRVTVRKRVATKEKRIKIQVKMGAKRMCYLTK